MALVSHQMKFYNLRVGRGIGQVTSELRALLDSEPVILGLCEATGYDIPRINGYALVRDRSTKSRANIAAYVRKDMHSGVERWIDLDFTWPRTARGGVHEARSWLLTRVGKAQVIVGHQPPPRVRNAAKGQMEGIDALTRRMKPKALPERPKIVMADWNRRKGETHGPSTLAKRIGGEVAGSRIDAFVWRGRGVKVDRVRYPTSIPMRHGVVKLKSDHDHAVVIRVTADERWWQKPKKR